MIMRNMLRAFALATTCLAPAAVYAGDFDVDAAPAPAAQTQTGNSGGFSGEAEMGLIGTGGTNPGQAGRYNGLNTAGVTVSLGEIDLRGRPAWDSGSTRYYELTGENLNIQTGHNYGSGAGRSGFGSGTNNSVANEGALGFRAGDQGTWGMSIDYDAITYTGNVIDSLYSVNGGQALLNNNLPAWGGATSGAKGITSYTGNQLLATGAMQPYQVGTRRDIVSGNFKYTFAEWTFNGAWRHEHKQGSMEEAFFSDNSAGEIGGVAFALPIDSDTDRYDLSASYNTRRFQSLLQYTYSHYADNISYVNLPYPFSNTKAPFQNSAAYSLPPSTDAHYVTLMLAGNVMPQTRVNLNARAGLEIQDSQFAPNTADPSGNIPGGILNANNQGTGTATALDAVATVYQLKASVASHPFKDAETRVFYGLDSRNVSFGGLNGSASCAAGYKDCVNVGGTGGGSDSSFTGLAYAVPQDWLKQNAGAEATYRILPESDTKVSVGYRFDSVERSNAQAGHSFTNTGTVALRSQLAQDIDGDLSFQYAGRSAKLSYLTPWESLAGSPSGQTYSGAYYQAPMTSEAVTARADYTPSHAVSAGLFLQFKNENYTYPAATPVGNATAATVPLTGTGEGIKQDFVLSAGPDFNYRPFDSVNLHAYYTFEMLFYNNTGNGACASVASAATAGCAGTAGYFQNKQTSTTHTMGLDGEWKLSEKLKLNADYTFSYGTVMFGEFNGVFVPGGTQSYQNVANYPDINSVMNNIKLRATYELAPNIDLIGQGTFTTFHNNDWNDGGSSVIQNAAGAIQILTPGYGSPNFSVATVLAGMRMRF